MNMHGIIRPDELQLHGPATRGARLREVMHLYRHFLTIVVLPTLLIAAYYYLIASDQYASRADYVVRRADMTVSSDGLAQLFGVSLGSSGATAESHLVSDYLLSHDAIARLRKEDNLVGRFHRDGIDLLSRLWSADPAPEKLEKYYLKHVTIEQDSDTGISHLEVHAFTPADSYAIASKLMQLGEERINQLNVRTYRDQVASAQRELDQANTGLSQAQETLTGFRRAHQDINPEGSGQAQIGLVSQLTGSLVAARARQRAMQGVISSDSPQYRAISAQVSALEAQIAGQSNRIAGSGTSIASSLGDYESLVIRRENAARRYAAVAAQYDQARAEAARKQIYLVRVVNANMPVKSLYPERGKTVLTVFFSLALAYGIGWLLLAGVREHSI
jgi:capsular polysaccharide transport system permease protein